jgi:hypothetical protein
MASGGCVPREAVVLAAALLIIAIVFLSPAYIRPDSVGVYSYLRSAVFDRDLLFFDEWNAFGLIRDGYPLFKEVTPLGTLANHWWIGTSVATLPFYVFTIFNGDGFTGISGWTLAWCSVLFTCVTLLIAASLIGARRPIALIAAVFGTPLFWYTFRWPLGTHAAGAMFVALAVYAGLRDRHFVAGLTLGLAIATRLQHFVLIPAFIVLAIRRREYSGMLRAAAGVIIGVLPQAIAWYAIYGSPLGPLTSGANLGGTTWMPFQSFSFGAVLFSSYHGLFIWSPVVLLAIIAWFEGLREHRDAAILFLLMLAGEWIANGAFDRYFWGGLSFGPRRFVDLAAPFAAGIGWFARSRFRTVIVAMATLWSCALTWAALAGNLSLSRYVSFSELLQSPFRAQHPIQLHSPISDAGQSLAALCIVVAAALALFFARRFGVIYVPLVSILLAFTIPATRSRAREEMARYKIQPKLAAHLGPLLDQRRLLGDEVDYLRAMGRDPRPTENEIAEIDRAIEQLTR